MAIAAVAIGLMVSVSPTREQRAIANLVKAGAAVAILDDPKGDKPIMVDMSYCRDNDELLGDVSEIENVQSVTLAPAPIHEAGLNCLLRNRSRGKELLFGFGRINVIKGAWGAFSRRSMFGG
jgi:hypothetical protein